MKSYKLLISRRGLKQLEHLDEETKKRIKRVLKCLSKNPFERRNNCDIKKLNTNTKHSFYRLRIGNYRIIYSVVNKKIMITEIVRRKKAYSFLE